jgi:RNA polymerase sigma factor (sigma-70 family)
MSDTDLQLLARYTRQHAEDAFAELVRRHLDLVFSAALRQVRSPQLAEEVAQSAFTDLARQAHRLAPDTILTAWLYQVTRRTAIDVVRREARRQLREQVACELNAMNTAAADWTDIEPLLDEAMHALEETDRTAVLLRYFEDKSLREVGQTLGTNEDAARKRVSRAVERLREYFAKRGVTVGASGLVVAISANAVQAAPAELALTISAAASALVGADVATAATATATKAIVMTTLQKALITATIAAAVGTGIYETRQASTGRSQVQILQQRQALLTEQLAELKTENERLPKLVAQAKDSHTLSQAQFNELLKLRGEVARLRGESKELAHLKASDLDTTNNPTEAAARAWAGRAADLIQRVGQMPEAKIPEFQFLTPGDWLDVAKDAALDTDTDVRNAVLMLGGLAKDQFAKLMRSALNGFLEAHQGELPIEIDQLKPFFPVSVEDGVLQRYQLLRSGNIDDISESDRMFGLVSEKPFAPVGSGRPLVKIGTQGFLRTGQ